MRSTLNSLPAFPFRSLPLLVGLLLHAPRAGAQERSDWRADVDRFASRVVELGIAPGIGLAVSQGDRVVHAAGFGMADLDAGRAVDEGTLFYIGSSTKALTATAIVAIAARGEIDLDAPVDRYVPGLRFAPPLDVADVSVADLLSMTDGIEAGGPVVVRTAYTGEFTPEILVELLASYGPNEDGTAFEYDNLPFNILGLALDPNDGHGWKAVVAREVLEPLGMEETSATLSTLDPGRIAMPHAIAGEEGWARIPLGKADANLHAAGGHFATPRDLARFVAAHASRGTLEGRRVFSEDVIARWEHENGEVRRGRPFVYSDLAIESLLALRELFRLPYRQTEGLGRALAKLLDVDLPIPHHTSLVKRAAKLSVNIALAAVAGSGMMCHSTRSKCASFGPAVRPDPPAGVGL